jgi:hypothetical protein
MSLRINPHGRFHATACAFSIVAGLLGTTGSSPALQIATSGARTLPPLLAVAVDFRGPIPDEAHPIVGAERLAKMRREGRLPDTFKRNGCTYNLAGDPGAAYYVKTCP